MGPKERRVIGLLARFLRQNVIALLALFLALGGTSYAAINLPRESVGAKQLKRNAVRTRKIRNGAVTKNKISKKTLAALAGSTGPQGPAGPQGPVGPSNGYGHPVTSPVAVGKSKTVNSLSLPAGTYLVLAEALPIQTNAGSSDAYCSLYLGSTEVDTGQAFLANPGTTFVTVSMLGVGTLASGGTASLRCQQATGTGKVEIYRSHITAVELESVTGG